MKNKNKPASQWFFEQYQFKTSRHTRLQRLGLKQQAVSRDLLTSDHFSRKELSKYRHKPPKYHLGGPLKSQTRHQKMAKMWGVGESHKFSTGLRLLEYVQIVYRNANGTCLKSVSKTHTFRFFRDFQLFQHPCPNFKFFN